MAEGLILPEANQILLITADGLQLANYPNVSYGTRKTADWSASTDVFAFRRPNIFADHKNQYIKKQNEKKAEKFVLMQRFLSNSQVSSSLTAIIARRG